MWDESCGYSGRGYDVGSFMSGIEQFAMQCQEATKLVPSSRGIRVFFSDFAPYTTHMISLGPVPIIPSREFHDCPHALLAPSIDTRLVIVLSHSFPLHKATFNIYTDMDSTKSPIGFTTALTEYGSSIRLSLKINYTDDFPDK